MVFSCCVRSCDPRRKQLPMHQLPKDTDLCLLWLKVIDREDLLEKNLQNYRICDRHFSVIWKVPNADKTCRTNLKRNAIPDQHLTGSVSEQQNMVDVSTSSYSVHFEEVSMLNDQEMLDGSTLSSASNVIGSLEGVSVLEQQDMVDVSTSYYSLPFEQVPSFNDQEMPDESTWSSASNVVGSLEEGVSVLEQQAMVDVSTSPYSLDIEDVPMFNDQEMPDGLTLSTSDVVGSLEGFSRAAPAMADLPLVPNKRKSKLPIKTGVRRYPRLMQKLPSNPKQLYAIAKDLKRTNQRLVRQNARNKVAVNKALQYSLTSNYLRATLNKTSYDFVMGQVKMLKKRSRGRRFTISDKVYALTLMKQSPRGYRLLQKTFALPSRRTLMRLLNRVRFRPGLNAHILNCLGKQVKNMTPLDRHCVLMFDEMSIEPGLVYNKHDDVIEGLQDCFTSKIAFVDHVMVFMIRGVRKKWKQPISFNFCEHGMKAEDLTRNIKEIIAALFDVGLEVVATVCDQLSVNTKAIKMLYDATDRDYLRAGKENRMFGFEVGGKEIVPLYDPPHLLKGLRNNLLENDVTFVRQGKEMRASWKDVHKLYEIDEGDKNTRMLNKLTDSHVIKEKMKKMKVAYAAQVFSHRVSSIMRGFARNAPGLLPVGAAGTRTSPQIIIL